MVIYVGDIVRRKKGHFAEVGEVLEVNRSRGRVHVKWPEKRIWYKGKNLIVVFSEHPF
jgi:hypothetical protein